VGGGNRRGGGHPVDVLGGGPGRQRQRQNERHYDRSDNHRTMGTLVPTFTQSNRSSTSRLYTRKQPSDFAASIWLSSLVPWMRMLGVVRSRARVPSGLRGPGGTEAGSPR